MVAESFLPQVNGVTNTVLRMLEHLRDTGHDAIVLAPQDAGKTPLQYAGFPVLPMASVGIPGYADVRVTTVTAAGIERVLAGYRPDVVHIAAPYAIGYKAAIAAAQLHLPSVAIYQTEVPTYAGRYVAATPLSYALTTPQVEAIVWSRVRRAHSLATLNFAPSTYARDQLLAQGVPRVGIWARGVDSARFHPTRRDESLRRTWAPNGERIIGFMGRLASEKRVEDLGAIADIPGTRLVIVGDGPQRKDLEKKLPGAVFTGKQMGDDLPRHLASFDLFVHTGDLETFCQAIQEAQASGLPVIAPRRGGPIDLVDPSHTGWLYEPGNLDQLRRFTIDLIGDDAKRAAFGRVARARVEHRTWPYICAQLVAHYREAIRIGVRIPSLTPQYDSLRRR